MSRIKLTFLGLCLTVLAFGQAKNQDKWERVISEMTKAKEGDTITYRSKKSLEWPDFKMLPDSNNNSKVHIVEKTDDTHPGKTAIPVHFFASSVKAL